MKNIILFVGVLFGLYSWTNKSNEIGMEEVQMRIPFQDDDYVYDFVDEMPQFPGGEKGLEKYIKDNLHYPKRVQKAGVSGRVYTECIIEKDGEVTHEKVYLGISRKLEGEALKLVQGMPNWLPGKNKSKPVRVKLMIPIDFELE